MHSVGNMRRPRSDCPDTQTERMRMLILSMLVSNVIRSFLLERFFFFFWFEVLRPSQPNGVMSSVVSLSNHTFTGQV